MPAGAYGACVAAKGVDPDAAKAFVKWLWIDQTDYQVDFSTSYGTHIPARPELAARSDKLASGPGADAAKMVSEVGHVPDLLWANAIQDALQLRGQQRGAQRHRPEVGDRRGGSQGEVRDRPADRLRPAGTDHDPHAPVVAPDQLDHPARSTRLRTAGGQKRLWFWVFVAPFLIGLVIFVYVPIGWSAYLSLFNARNTPSPRPRTTSSGWATTPTCSPTGRS